jgi:hypothetical protein
MPVEKVWPQNAQTDCTDLFSCYPSRQIHKYTNTRNFSNLPPLDVMFSLDDGVEVPLVVVEGVRVGGPAQTVVSRL